MAELEAVLSAERAALAAQGGITDGTVAVGVKPSTPRQPADVRPERLRSNDPADFPEITGREEEWRFTPLDRLRRLLDADADVTSTGALTVDGHAWPGADGVTLAPLTVDDPLLADLPPAVDVLAARAAGAAVTALRVAKAAEPAEPIVLQRTARADQVLFDHLVIEVAEQARATVVLEHTGPARLVGKVSILVGDGAALDLVQVRTWDADALESTHVATRVGRDARFRSTSVTLGGSLVRVTETVDFTAPGADVELRGLALADDGQHLEHRLLVDHSAPHCRSRVTYKNALQGDEAHTVWIGDVLIRAQAVGTDTYETNRNLLLTPDARADAVPNLEIETGEIAGAGHASATGRFDDEQLFYLQSRGIDPDTARRLVVHGFFAEVIEQIGVPELQDRLMAAVAADLGQVDESLVGLADAVSDAVTTQVHA